MVHPLRPFWPYIGVPVTATDPTQRDFAPEFSIIVAVYNSERYLAETLRSFQAQTLKQFEVVMVNDGSTDGSPQIAEQFCREDSRFRLYSTPNQGISATRNLAVQHSSAPWIAVCDGDDTWEPDKLERQAEYIRSWAAREDETLTGVGTAGDLITSTGDFISTVTLHYRPWPELLADETKMLQLNVINSSAVFRRDIFLNIGGYREDYTPTEDLDLWVRLAEQGAFVNMPDLLTHYRMHDKNLSRTRYARMIECAKRVRVNSARRGAGLPELDEAAYAAYEQEQPGHAEAALKLRHMVFYNQAKNNLYNRQYGQAAVSLLKGFLISPRLSVALVSRSRVFQSSRLHLRKSFK